MIKTKDIQVQETEQQDYVEMRARPTLTVVYRIANEEKQFKNKIREKLRYEVWHDIYGELRDPNNRLMLEARKESHDPSIIELCDQINELLNPESKPVEQVIHNG